MLENTLLDVWHVSSLRIQVRLVLDSVVLKERDFRLLSPPELSLAETLRLNAAVLSVLKPLRPVKKRRERSFLQRCSDELLELKDTNWVAPLPRVEL